MSVDGHLSDVSVQQGSRLTVEASFDPSDLFLFSRDLGGTVTDVLVAAAGRALGAEGAAAHGSPAPGVGVAVPTPTGLVIPVVRNAASAPLPDVRSEVGRLVEAARAGRLATDDVGGAALVLDDSELAAGAPGGAVDPSCCGILALASQPDESGDVTLTLVVDTQATATAAAERLLTSFVRLLERPYRRLV